MGYDLHITRKELWSDEDDLRNIPLEEWLAYIELDPELEISEKYQIRDPDKEGSSKAAPGFCEWLGHSTDDDGWFDYFQGCISTKNPDDETIRKMLSIARALNARVQGDDGEVYNLSSDNQVSSGHPDAGDLSKSPMKLTNKPWWKIW
jgi:hypothetical protein